MTNQYGMYKEEGRTYITRRESNEAVVVAVKIKRFATGPNGWDIKNIPDIKVPWKEDDAIDTEYAERLLGIEQEVI